MRALALAPALIAASAACGAEAPLSGAAFDALTRGRTLSYAQGGFVYGMEEYLPGNRVRWSFLDGECHEGEWYEAGEMICFVYEGPAAPEGPQCWRFVAGDGGLVAYFMDDPEGVAPVTTRPTPEPLLCTGPKVGV